MKGREKRMIEVDISEVWGQISLPDLLGMEQEVFAAHLKLTEESNADSLKWLGQSVPMQAAELERIRLAAERIREESEVCLVLGTGSVCQGARGAIELLQGQDRNFCRGKGDPLLFFAGNSLNSRRWKELTGLLEGKDFSVIVISESEIPLETAATLRSLKWMMERKYGTDETNSRIYAVTGPGGSQLRRMAGQGGWEQFAMPAGAGDRYAPLTAAGLLPMAVAGIDIAEVVRGALAVREDYDIRSFENPVWLYAAVRNLLGRNGKALEVLASFEPGFRGFGLWWQQLFAGAEGKDGKGIFPVTAEFPGDFYSMGQMLLGGQRNLFETMLRFQTSGEQNVISRDVEDLGGLNGLSGKSLDFAGEEACFAALQAHIDGDVPVLAMDCGELDAAKLGELFYFMGLGCGLSAAILGVDPAGKPAVEDYVRALRTQLGIPEAGDE